MLREMNSELPDNYKKVYEDVKQDVHFANVDLEIWSKEDLQIIFDEFGKNVLEMANFTFDNGNKLASFELSLELVNLNAEANEMIKAFCSLIENFTNDAKIVWNNCYKKVFDVGFESGNTEKSFSTLLENQTLKKVSEIGAEIVITIYPVLDYSIEIENNNQSGQ